jgi:hypothetical protein
MLFISTIPALGKLLGAPAISAIGGVMPCGAGAPLRGPPDYLPNTQDV